MTTRRNFLKNIAWITTGSLAVSAVEADASSLFRSKLKAGIQLWTLRDAITTDLGGTLSALAEIGYENLEPYGFDGRFYGHEPAEFRKMCSDLGMAVISTHSCITLENAPLYAEKAAEAGLHYLVLPSFCDRPSKTTEDYKKAAAEMNQIAAVTRKSGIALGYHNHKHEFEILEGVVPYDILLAETDPELVSFQVDLFWMKKAGVEPASYFSKFPGRFATWHIKDMGMDGSSCIIGNGKLNFREMMKHSREAGLRQLFVEQEEYAEGTPLYCAGQSYRYIRKHLL